MKIVRLILIFLVGCLLTNLTYKSQFRNFFGDAVIWLVLVTIGTAVLFWTLIKDLKLYTIEKKIQNFGLSFLCILFIGIILYLDIKIQRNFNKPSILKVYYDGDYNGISIDFKEDGTYIFDNSAIGLSDYTYGVYKIDSNKITLDKGTIDNITNLKNLEIRARQIDYHDSRGRETYLFQVNEKGDIIENGFEYRIVFDNRK